MARILARSEWDTDDDIGDENDAELSAMIVDIGLGQTNDVSSSDEEESDIDDDSSCDAVGHLFDRLSSSVIGRDGTTWIGLPVLSRNRNLNRSPAHNIFSASPGVWPFIQALATSPYEAWKLFIDERILRQIVTFTNDEAERRGENNFSLTLLELEAF